MSYPQDYESKHCELKGDKQLLAQYYNASERSIRLYNEILQAILIDRSNKLNPKPTQKEIDDAFEILSNDGYNVSKIEDKKQYDHEIILKDNEIKIGIVSDTHLGSNHQQLTHLHSFYKYCDSQDIKTILHAGDLSDGENVYKGQRYETFCHGITNQKRYIVENYPKINDIKTYVISGNHDLSFRSNYGYDILEEVSLSREDIIKIGDNHVIKQIGDLNVCLQHGDSGMTIGHSYKLQKYNESYLLCKKDIDIFVLGHYHINCILPDYKDVLSIMPGSFQGQTSFLSRKGITPNISGVIITLDKLKKDGIIKISSEIVKFKNEIINDY